MLRRIRTLTAKTLRRAARLLPQTRFIPIRITRWFWNTAADLLAPEEEPAPQQKEAPPVQEKAAPALPEIDVVALEKMLKEEIKPLLLDVREPQETATGYIPEATLIPLGEVRARLSEIKEARRPVVVYCAHGSRSAQAAAFLHSEGLYAVSLSGGIAAWQAAGHPLTTKSAPGAGES